ncbi:membrane protein [Streptomyces sp. NRRL WC-3753]|nr:membrane protein [Streptomyces sp. NRRL WC-3753]
MRERGSGQEQRGQARGHRFRVRDGAVIVLFVVIAGGVVLFGFGGARWAAREVAPVLYGLPGGAWSIGGVLGLVTLLGWGGALSERFASRGAGESGRASGVVRAVVRGACCVAALAPVFFLLSGVQGKNCRSYEEGCAYVAGTGPTLLVYAGCVVGAGWLIYRWRRAVLEERRAWEGERLRKLRRKGKGKSRPARQR